MHTLRKIRFALIATISTLLCTTPTVADNDYPPQVKSIVSSAVWSATAATTLPAS